MSAYIIKIFGHGEVEITIFDRKLPIINDEVARKRYILMML